MEKKIYLYKPNPEIKTFYVKQRFASFFKLVITEFQVSLGFFFCCIYFHLLKVVMGSESNGVAVSPAKAVEPTRPVSRKRSASQSEFDGPQTTDAQGSKTSSPVKKRPKKKHSLPAQFIVQPSSVKFKLTVKDLRDLVLYIVGDGRAPTWMGIQNKPAIKKLVSVMIPSIYPSDFGHTDIAQHQPQQLKFPEDKPSRHLSFFKSHVPYIWPVKAPGSKVSLHSSFEEFTEVPLTKEEKKALNNSQKKKAGLDPIDCILSFQQLIENNYPIHPETRELPAGTSPALEDGWVDTLPSKEGKNTPLVFGLDCEMCTTASGKVVTRITLVKNDKTTVYDELVKPDEPITDYLTRYSGITKEMLDPVTKTLPEAQQDLLKLINSTDILVGHSLESDLNVLFIRHPLVVDTAICYGTSRGNTWKPALRTLTSQYLNREIQKGHDGHNSVEDAVACLDLLKLKLEHGLHYGNKVDTKSIADRLSTSSQGPKSTAVIDYQTKRWNATAANIVQVNSDEEVISQAIKQSSQRTNFVWTRLLDIHRLRSLPEGPSEEELDSAFKRVDSQLSRLYSSLPANTALLIWTSHGNQKEMYRLQAKKRQYQIDYQTKKWDEIADAWTDKDNQQLLQATELARAGAAFMLIKGQEISEPETKSSNGQPGEKKDESQAVNDTTAALDTKQSDTN